MGFGVGMEYHDRPDLELASPRGGGLTWTWEGNLPIKDTGGIVNGQYNNAWIVIPSLYAKWEF